MNTQFSGHTAWARNLAAPLRSFLNTETSSALALLGASLAALIWANLPWWESYESFWTTDLAVRIGDDALSLDLREWVNQGLMTLFFLVVGLEAKRELDLGELRDRRRVAIPVLAALGGLAVPVLIFVAINAGEPSADGWGAAMSTDTAFALGLLALVAPQATRLRVRLLTIVVIDDLVALIVIATVYTEHIEMTPLLIALALFAVLLGLRFVPFGGRLQVAALLGVAIWVALHESGVDPVITGLVVGLATTAYTPARGALERATEQTRTFREQPTPQLARSAQAGIAAALSVNERLQYRLHPWTSYVIVPLFALANLGIHIDGRLLSDAATSPITLGIICAYVIGKPVGISLAAWLASRPWLSGLRLSLSWPVIVGGGAVAGLGFTVALLVATIAFSGEQLAEAKLGILGAAIIATLLSLLIFRVIIPRLPASMRERQPAGATDAILDLSDDIDPGRDHIRGPDDAPVTLVEYGDYQCPYCGQAEVVIRSLLDSFGDDLRYVWRHLPLNDVHPNAQIAAEAAEAAGAQGRFWEMHDRLLDNQDQLMPTDLARHANDIGLDMHRFWDDLRRRDYAERVGEDVASADMSGVAGTPTFFINGARHQGAYDIDTLAEAVRRARKLAQQRRAVSVS
jgi:Na+/H+ antiporter NhaA